MKRTIRDQTPITHENGSPPDAVFTPVDKSSRGCTFSLPFHFLDNWIAMNAHTLATSIAGILTFTCTSLGAQPFPLPASAQHLGVKKVPILSVTPVIPGSWTRGPGTYTVTICDAGCTITAPADKRLDLTVETWGAGGGGTGQNHTAGGGAGGAGGVGSGPGAINNGGHGGHGGYYNNVINPTCTARGDGWGWTAGSNGANGRVTITW